MKAKRFITHYGDARAVDKIHYDSWGDQINISSYFVDDEVMKQIEQFYPTSIEVI